MSRENVEKVRISLDAWNRGGMYGDVTIELSDVRDLGDTVIALGRVRARGEASGIDMDAPIAYVFEFDGGLARTVRAYLDPADGLEAVGLG